MRKNKTVIIGFTIPCVFALVVVYLYPVLRTTLMSFFQIDSVTSDMSKWTFNGFENYIQIIGSPTFQRAIKNVCFIWILGGAIILTIALVFAVILTSGVRFKKFFRAAIYLPNTISAVALATMWIQYIYNQDYGLLNNLLEVFGVDGIKWLGTDTKFWAMLIAYAYGSVGYYMLILISGIERIPQELYESATIDGGNRFQQFRAITLPLLKGVIKTCVTFWSIGSLSFYTWSKMFSPVSSEASTVVPVVYLYDMVFGSMASEERNAGVGAAVGVTLAVLVVLIYFVINKVLKDDKVEY